MGVTIHYAGQLRNPARLQQLTDFSRDYAAKHTWAFNLLPFAVGNLQGFAIHPDYDCEPIEFRFGIRNRFSSWVKTQFAGPGIHIQVVEFLREIKPVLGRLGVRDEGEFWETGSRPTLEWHMNKVHEIIVDYVTKNPEIRTKVRTPDGRIIDLIE